MAIIEKSILKTVRRYVTKSNENDFFDLDLIMAINEGFLILNQLGVGPEEVFVVENEKDYWEDFTDEEPLLNTVTTYICRFAQKEVDPPSNGTLMQSLTNTIDQLEWRLRHAAEIQLKEGE